MKPSVGDIVYYKESMQADPWAAIVQAVRKDDVSLEQKAVDLQIFSPISGGVHIARAIPYSEKLTDKCWSSKQVVDDYIKAQHMAREVSLKQEALAKEKKSKGKKDEHMQSMS